MSGLSRRDWGVVVLLSGILAVLYGYGRSLDVGEEQLIAPNLRTVSANDARVNENVALLRTGLYNDYDHLNLLLNEIDKDIRRIENQLLSMSLPGKDGLEDQMRALRERFRTKEELVERFKSTNAVLRNSNMFIALTASRIGDDPERYRDILGGTGQLSILLMKFYRTQDDVTAKLIRHQVARLKRSTGDPSVLQQLEQLRRHAHLTVEFTPINRRTVADIASISLRDNAESVMQVYSKLVAIQRVKARTFRWTIYALSIVLLGYVSLMLWRLGGSRRALVSLNLELTREKDRAQATLQSIGDGVATLTRSGIVEYLNPVAERLTHWPLAEARGRNMREVIPIIDAETGEPLSDADIASLVSGSGTVRIRKDTLLRGRDGTEHRIEISASPIHGTEGDLPGMVMILRDISETRRLIDRISHQAEHDALTGLVNRWEFERRLKQLLIKNNGTTHHHALCYVDLDQFKIINDTCGHMAGDELLRQLSRSLTARVRTADTLARLGGDEFGVLLADCPLPRAVEIAEQLREVVHEYEFHWEGNRFRVGASVGVVPLSPDETDANLALTHADLACYAAKDMGRNRVHIYSAGDSALARRQQEMVWATDIRQAVADDRLRLYVQPIVATAHGATAVDHYEVLVRLVDHRGEEIFPSDFIPAAERFGVMPDVDRWVIDHTFEWVARHHSAAATRFMCINLSGTSLGEPGLPEFIEDRWKTHGLDTRQIFFEITETAAVANLNEAASLIERLRAQGVRFSLDDFGSGLSSFNYLKTLPVDYLKIDGNIVRNMVHDPVYRAMVEAINHVGHVMGKLTVAEFVENDQIRTELVKLGVDFVQGYGIGKPVPLSTLEP